MKVLDQISVGNGKAAGPAPRRRSRTLWLVAAAVLLLGAVAVFFAARARFSPATTYATQPVLRQDLVATVTATGTVNPQDLINVGTQVSGTISELDVDYNSKVHAGQLLARIDPTSLQAAYRQSTAAQVQAQQQAGAGAANAAAAASAQRSAERLVAADRAALASARSQVDKAQASLALADLTLARDRGLLAQGYVAQNAVDTDTSNDVAARAALAAATIAVDQAQSQLAAQIATAAASAAQATSARSGAAANAAAIDVQRALVSQAAYNLDHSVIVSPVDGTVIARNVSIGQTVAASFQTPTLFSIARDLTKMQVDIATGEPDIGGVRPGAVADFTVLAYPNRAFRGTVWQVRQNPTTLNNVVTYDTVLLIPNPDGALRPGMTANASIHVGKVQNALVVPVQALQYAPASGPRRSPGANATVPASPWGATEASVGRTVVAGRNGRIFVQHGPQIVSVPVRVTLVAGAQAAVQAPAGKLAAGDRVVVSDSASATSIATPPPALGVNRGLR